MCTKVQREGAVRSSIGDPCPAQGERLSWQLRPIPVSAGLEWGGAHGASGCAPGLRVPAAQWLRAAWE